MSERGKREVEVSVIDQVIEQYGDSSPGVPLLDDSEFYVAASDARGHQETKSFRLPQGLLADMSREVKHWQQYRGSDGALIRHALLRHLILLRRWRGAPVSSNLAQIQAMQDILMAEELQQGFSVIFDRLDRFARSEHDEAGRRETRRVLNMLSEKIGHMPEGYWRDKFKKRLLKDYGHLMEEAQRVNFAELGESE